MTTYNSHFEPKNPQAESQLSKWLQMAVRLNCPEISVSGTHTSKSLELPVMVMNFDRVSFAARDNFHDVNVMVKSLASIDIPLSFFYEQHGFDWYQEAINKKRGYSFRDWTDDEINDHRILRVKRKNGNGWCEVKGDEKDRWTNRFNSTEWYVRDWSSGLLITEGPTPFDANTKFYDARQPFAEGIKCGTLKPYAGPCQEFINCLGGWNDLERIISGINAALH